MPTARKPPPRRRADAERSVERILEAAVDALATDPEPSMAEIAGRAGVVRATIYAHFPTRESLVEAVTLRAVGEVTRLIEAAEPERGDPAEALERVVGAQCHVSMILALVHAASAELRSGRTPADELEAAVVATVLGAVSGGRARAGRRAPPKRAAPA